MNKSILEVVHAEIKGLYDIGLVDATTMREFDIACLAPPEEMSKNKIKSIRLNVGVSQAVFAKYLNSSESAVKKWESGEKKPLGIALRLLQLIEHGGLEIFDDLLSEEVEEERAAPPRRRVVGHGVTHHAVAKKKSEARRRA
jgi:putative transcriptional regulator